MKPLSELRDLSFRIDERVICQIKSIPKRYFDFEVYLPTKGKNLQRDFVWDLQQKRELIWSIFYGRRIPFVCIMACVNDANPTALFDINVVIDGKQRITTFLQFLNNEFSLEYEGKEYFLNDLPEEYQLVFKNYYIIGHVACEEWDKRFTDAQKIEWFMRVNYAGTPQDIEHLKSLL